MSNKKQHKKLKNPVCLKSGLKYKCYVLQGLGWHETAKFREFGIAGVCFRGIRLLLRKKVNIKHENKKSFV